jgi:hypothetical protein
MTKRSLLSRPLPLLVALSLVLTACKDDPPLPPTQPLRTTKPTKTKPKLVHPPAAPHDAYLLMRHTNDLVKADLYRLHGGKVFPLSLKPHCRHSLTHFLQGNDGTLWITCSMKLLRISGSTITATKTDFVFSGLGDIGLSPKGDVLYYASEKGLRRYAKGKWTNKELPPKALEGKNPSPRLAIDGKDRVWLALDHGVWVYEGGAFRQIEIEGEKEPPLHRYIVATKGDAVWVVSQKGKYYRRMIRIDGKKPTISTLGESKLSVDALRADPRGGFFVLNSGQAIWANDKGKVTRKLYARTPILGKIKPKAVALDSKGKLWLGTTFNLVLVNAKGTITQWEPKQVAGLPHYIVNRVVVAGEGPKLPALGPKVRGTVKGQIAGAVNALVEMCPGVGSIRKFYGKTPCAAAKVKVVTKTDAKGNFTLEGVPPYMMNLVHARGEGRWGVKRPRCCAKLEAGKTIDLGKLGS